MGHLYVFISGIDGCLVRCCWYKFQYMDSKVLFGSCWACIYFRFSFAVLVFSFSNLVLTFYSQLILCLTQISHGFEIHFHFGHSSSLKQILQLNMCNARKRIDGPMIVCAGVEIKTNVT